MEVEGKEDYYQSSESENEESVVIAKQEKEARNLTLQDYAADFESGEKPMSPELRDSVLDQELIDQLNDTAEEIKALDTLDGSLLTEVGKRYVEGKTEAVDLYMIQLVLQLLMKSTGKSASNHPLSESIQKMNSFLQRFQPYDSALNQQAERRIAKEPKLQKQRKTVNHVSFQEALEKSESESGSEEANEGVPYPNIPRRSTGGLKSKFTEIETGKTVLRKAKAEILKPKGLVRKRKQTERNPRIKNKLKYEKAEKKRRSTYGYKEKTFSAYYEGERTGIRKDIVRSTKLT